ncbi:hypothetical protein GGF41_005018 [Coemansia sp. RSA 2531]|nr:hypothetical protein GGF41_005018 [Coemansia sp. RSA 2531]
MDKPAFLIKDLWMTTGGGSAGDSCESLLLSVLHAEFNKSSEFSGSFVQIVSAGPMYINRGNNIVVDSTATAFAGLPSTVQNAAKDSDNAQGSSSSCVRQHRRTVTKWTGNMISKAENQSQVVVAVADAMTVLNAAYVKCNILHSNISDRAILLQQMVDGIKGVLAEFDYASYAGANADESPELMLFQSIRSLDNPRAIRTPLDDCESLLYLVCWLGTFGVNQAQRAAYAARHAAGFELHLPIKNWNQGTAAHIASYKRLHMATEAIFCDAIVSRMSEDEDSPLQNLVMDIYRVLFLHPGCYGTIWLSNRQFARVMDVDIRAALHEVPVINGKRDPLVLRYAFMAAILANLLGVLARHRDVALAALGTAAANTEGGS